MKKHLIACGILSTMFMATSFAQKDIDRPIMGWSSWNTYHVNISEELIKQQADALIKHGLKEAGYNYINIDDGFFGYRDETGKMHPNISRLLVPENGYSQKPLSSRSESGRGADAFYLSRPGSRKSRHLY